MCQETSVLHPVGDFGHGFARGFGVHAVVLNLLGLCTPLRRGSSN